MSGDHPSTRDVVQRLTQIRRERGLTTRQVAARMHCCRVNVTRLERDCIDGTRSPSIETLTRYAQAIGVELTIGVNP